MTTSEGFAQSFAHAPGCFLFIGNGEASAPLHHPGYDFHDAALLHGTKLHTAIAPRCLPMAGQVF